MTGVNIKLPQEIRRPTMILIGVNIGFHIDFTLLISQISFGKLDIS